MGIMRSCAARSIGVVRHVAHMYILMYGRVSVCALSPCVQNIEVKSNLPGVGRNLRDHPAVSKSCLLFFLVLP